MGDFVKDRENFLASLGKVNEKLRDEAKGTDGSLGSLRRFISLNEQMKLLVSGRVDYLVSLVEKDDFSSDDERGDISDELKGMKDFLRDIKENLDGYRKMEKGMLM